jgi:hypothetical protein
VIASSMEDRSLAYLFRTHATDTWGPSQPVVTEEA